MHKSPNRAVLIVSWILLFLALASFALFTMDANSQKQALNQTIDRYQVADQVNALEQKSLRATIAAGEIVQNSYSQVITQVSAEKESLRATQEQMRTQLDANAVLQSTQGADIQNLQQQLGIANRVNCGAKDLFKPDYTSNETMSLALRHLIEDNGGGKVKTAVWNVLWDGARAAQHYIELTYQNGLPAHYQFIVWFKEKSYLPGVFWVNNECWLDK
jgi:hypothetical protein